MSTGIPIVDWFLSVLDAWGYAIVFFFTIFENVFIVGSLTPGETVVVAAAFVAGRGQLVLPLVFISSVAGTLTGANVTYWLGRRVGIVALENFVERFAETRFGRLLGVRLENVAEMHDHFHTVGARTVLISRFAAGAKNMVPAFAGATKMPLFWFELYSVLGALIYTSINCAIGWFLGENMDRALRAARNVGIGGLLIFVAFIVFVVYTRRRIVRRREAAIAEKAECEPGEAEE
jgi:membrane protein DedA with SNARE-associated domain